MLKRHIKSRSTLFSCRLPKVDEQDRLHRLLIMHKKAVGTKCIFFYHNNNEYVYVVYLPTDRILTYENPEEDSIVDLIHN